MAEEILWGKDIDDLIKKFEADMRHSSPGIQIRFLSSVAKDRLLEKGPVILGHVAEHFRNNNFADYQVNIGWGLFLSRMEEEIDPNRTGPEKLNEPEEWFEWAKKFAE